MTTVCKAVWSWRNFHQAVCVLRASLLYCFFPTFFVAALVVKNPSITKKKKKRKRESIGKQKKKKNTKTTSTFAIPTKKNYFFLPSWVCMISAREIVVVFLFLLLSSFFHLFFFAISFNPRGKREVELEPSKYVNVCVCVCERAEKVETSPYFAKASLPSSRRHCLLLQDAHSRSQVAQAQAKITADHEMPRT